MLCIKKNLIVLISFYICYVLPFTFNHQFSSVRNVKCKASSKDLQFDLGKVAFSLIPLTPESIGRRKTLLKEVAKNSIWTLDQLQGIINVNVPVRCTVVKLKKGGLFVHNPVAPTVECINLIRSLESKHGPVKYIILSSLGIEHKGTTGVFTTNFPSANVYVQPGQYSFPIDLPTQFYFPIGTTIKEIPYNSQDAPWYSDFDHEVLIPLKAKSVGGFSETAFYHRDSGTLLVTDVVVKVEDAAPAIVDEDPRCLLYHARDNMLDIVKDTPANRQKGWRRMVLFGLVFFPSGIRVLDLFEALKLTKQVDQEMKKLGRGTIPIDEALYPWTWERSELPSFKALQGGLLVAPILQKLLLNREPQIVYDWVTKICRWPFIRIIPCHLANDLKAGPADFKKAFNFLLEKPATVQPFQLFSVPGTTLPNPLEEDLALLNKVSIQLTDLGVIKPPGKLISTSK